MAATSSPVPQEFTALVDQFKLLPEPKRYIDAFTYVRDISYGDIGSRNPYDVLLAKKGTCSGKHALLKLLLEALGYQVQSHFAKHDFSKFPIQQWPNELVVFQTQIIPDYHDFLKVNIGGQWLTIDGIFDKPLKKFGFPVADWDGKTNMQLPVQATETFPAEGDVEDHKKRLISALPEDQQKVRKQFLSALTAWLDKNRT